MSTNQSLYAAPGHPGAEPLFMPNDHQQAKAIKLGDTQYYCPLYLGGCGQPLLVAYNWESADLEGKVNRPHFRHRSHDSPCTLQRNVETHRRIQELIKDHLESQGHEVMLERYHRESRSRADIYVTGGPLGAEVVSLEVQLSGLSHDQFVHRTRRYQQSAGMVQWLFSKNCQERRDIIEVRGHAIAPRYDRRQDTLELELLHEWDNLTIPLERWNLGIRGLWCPEMIGLDHLAAERENQILGLNVKVVTPQEAVSSLTGHLFGNSVSSSGSQAPSSNPQIDRARSLSMEHQYMEAVEVLNTINEEELWSELGMGRADAIASVQARAQGFARRPEVASRIRDFHSELREIKKNGKQDQAYSVIHRHVDSEGYMLNAIYGTYFKTLRNFLSHALGESASDSG